MLKIRVKKIRLLNWWIFSGKVSININFFIFGLLLVVSPKLATLNFFSTIFFLPIECSQLPHFLLHCVRRIKTGYKKNQQCCRKSYCSFLLFFSRENHLLKNNTSEHYRLHHIYEACRQIIVKNEILLDSEGKDKLHVQQTKFFNFTVHISFHKRDLQINGSSRRVDPE